MKTLFFCTALFVGAIMSLTRVLADGIPIVRCRIASEGEQTIHDIVVSPDREWLAIACDYRGDPGMIRIYSLKLFKDLARLEGHKQRVLRLVLSKDGRRLYSAGEDGQCKVWDMVSRRLIRTFEADPDGVTDLSLSPDEATLATSGLNGVRSWDVEQKRQLAKFDTSVPVIRLIHLANKKVLLGDEKGTIYIWDSGQKPVPHRKAHNDIITCMTMSPDRRMIATGAQDGLLKLWDAASWDLVKTWGFDDDYPFSAAFAPGGRTLCVGGRRGELIFYNVSSSAFASKRSANLIATSASYWIHDHHIARVVYGSDGRLLVSSSLDGTAAVLERLPDFKE